MPPSSPLLQAELERIGRERLASERGADRVRWRELFRVCAECLGSTFLGMMCMGFALHTRDRDVGMIAFWGGLIVGYAGITLALAAAYRRGEDRGDW